MSESEIIAVPSSSGDQSEDVIAVAERRIANLQRVKEVALKVTNHQDWIDQNGKPYMVASAAEKVGRLFRISWGNLKSEKIMSQDENGPFYFYQVSGVFTLQGESIVAIGTTSSKDQFFAISKGEQKPLSQIDETNIMKSAYSNCVVNGITRILGLRNMTWEEVEKSGIRRDTVASVSYSGNKAKAPPTEDELKVREKIRGMLLQICGNSKDAADKLEVISSFTTPDGKSVKGKRIADYLSGKWLLSTYGKVQAEYKAKFGKDFGEDGADDATDQ